MTTPSSKPLVRSVTPVAGLDLLSLARSLVAGVRHGRHRSLARGGSAEFYDYRAYTPGDSIRLLDWRLLGRSDRAYVRRFTQESRLDLTLIVDATESMWFSGFEGAGPSKVRRACELSAALALIAARSGDRVGLIVARSSVPDVVPSSAGAFGAERVIDALERLLEEGARPSQRGAGAIVAGLASRRGASSSAMLSAIDAARRTLHRGGVVVVLSDGLDPIGPFAESVRRIRQGSGAAVGGGGGGGGGVSVGVRCDVAMVQVLTDDERHLEAAGAAVLVDPETNQEVSTDLDAIRAEFASAIRTQVDGMRRAIESLGGRHVLSTTSVSALQTLRSLFR